jgi:uncharacterized membrane protein
VIPTEGSEEPKRPATPPVPEASDDETFEDRLRRAIVRHFQFSWSELGQARRAERQKPESEMSGAARPDAGSCVPAEAAPDGATAEPLPPGAPAEATPPPTPGGNGSGPAHSGESGPTLPPDRQPF